MAVSSISRSHRGVALLSVSARRGADKPERRAASGRRFLPERGHLGPEVVVGLARQRELALGVIQHDRAQGVGIVDEARLIRGQG